MEPEKEENLPLELTEGKFEKFLREVVVEGFVGKTIAVSGPLLQGFFSLPPELGALLGAMGTAGAGILYYIPESVKLIKK